MTGYKVNNLEHKSQAILNDIFKFTYHDKPREGRLVKAEPTFFDLELVDDHDGQQFKRFNWDKVQGEIQLV